MLLLYCMRIFVSNHTVAKSHFWYFCVSTEDDEEILGENGLLWTGVGEISTAGEELRHLAVLWPPQRHPQHAPGARDLTTAGAPSPSATETWALAPSPGPLNPDCEGGGDRSQQVPPTSGQAVPRLQDQVPTATPGPPSPAQATLHYQEAQYLLLGAGPLCPQVCPNKIQVGKPEKKKKTQRKGDFQDSSGLRYGDCLPPHKYICMWSDSCRSPTEHWQKIPDFKKKKKPSGKVISQLCS